MHQNTVTVRLVDMVGVLERDIARHSASVNNVKERMDMLFSESDARIQSIPTKRARDEATQELNGIKDDFRKDLVNIRVKEIFGNILARKVMDAIAKAIKKNEDDTGLSFYIDNIDNFLVSMAQETRILQDKWMAPP